MPKKTLEMGTNLLYIATTAKQEVADKKAHEARVRKEHEKESRKNAEHALEVFSKMLGQLIGVKSYKVGPSKLIRREPCLVVEDAIGRKFEIHYNKPMMDGKHFGGGNADYHANIQWGNQSWYTYSVSMGAQEVAKLLGRWLAETETATDSLKCK